jgi:hypothetical protein
VEEEGRSVNQSLRATTLPSGRCSSCEHFAAVGEITQCSRCDCPRHVAGPRQPQSPAGAEAALAAYSDALDEAVEKLQQARDAELDAEEARDKAKWEAQLSPDCPPVGVFDGVRTTVAMQAAWVARAIAAEETAYRAAKVVRQAASAHLDKLNSQRSIAQTISKSVAGSYQGTGDRW